ncbi:MAG: hypothetical protein ISS90_01875 [Candidatus Omnitrophica bacterium]|nr:hypothetical protein [Candidatus Omnitrophota bacterium]
MKKIFAVLTIFALISLTVSCSPYHGTKETLKGTGRGTTDIVEGAGRGVTNFAKGSVDTVKETAEATGEFVTGRGSEASESGRSAVNAGAGGIKDIIVEPVKGVGKGLQSIDRGIKRATGREDIK